MITFGTIKTHTPFTVSGRNIVDVEIIYSGETYDWKVYVPNIAGINILNYLTTNAAIYEADIAAKEALWLTVPHTRIVNGNVVSIPKSEVVSPNIPDFEEANNNPSWSTIAIKRLLQSLTTDILASPTITQEQIDDLATISEYWKAGVTYAVDKVLNYEGKLYKVVQAHTSQADWLPSSVPALYTIYVPAGTISPWVQPTGAQDAYNIGDKVSFEGSNYESLINANTWSPSVYPQGWLKL